MPSTPVTPPSNRSVSHTASFSNSVNEIDAGATTFTAAARLVNVATGDSNFGSTRPLSGMLYPRGIG